MSETTSKDKLEYKVDNNISPEVAMEVTLPLDKLEVKASRPRGRPKGSKNLASLRKAATILTPNKVKQFLRVLERLGSVTSAAAYCGVSRDTIYKRTAKDPGFKESVEIARSKFTSTLEEAAIARGVDGVDEPIFNKHGELIGHKKKYSDVLLGKLLAAADPERYGNNSRNETTIKQDITVNAGESAKDKLANLFGLKDITPKPEALEDRSSIGADYSEDGID